MVLVDDGDVDGIVVMIKKLVDEIVRVEFVKLFGLRSGGVYIFLVKLRVM